MKKMAAFIDHPFHKKTRSSDFIKELLSEKFDITCYYDESWSGNKKIDIEDFNTKKYEYIFYFQRIHKIHDIKKINESRIVFFPMEDSYLYFSELEWLEYSSIPLKIVCFSKTLFEKLQKLKIDCVYLQYFLNPELIQPVNNYISKKIYFWNRTEEINWQLIKKLLGSNRIDSITYLAVPDPNRKIELPDEMDIKKYNIKIYDTFLEEQEYLRVVKDSNIYIAPRKYEGIGMSFIEALARGQCVIAPDSMTMNEYIVNNVNGYIYDLNNANEIDLSNFEFIGREARNRSNIFFENWKKQKNKLFDYIFIKDNLNLSSKIKLLIRIKSIQMFEIIRIIYMNIYYLIIRIHRKIVIKFRQGN